MSYEKVEKSEYTVMLENKIGYMQGKINELEEKLEIAKENFIQELKHSAKLERALKSTQFTLNDYWIDKTEDYRPYNIEED